MATGRQIEGRYIVHIVMRGFDQCADDYHATVTRISDDTQLVFISEWKWWLRWKIRRKALDRAFKWHDKRQRKLAETEDRVI